MRLAAMICGVALVLSGSSTLAPERPTAVAGRAPDVKAQVRTAITHAGFAGSGSTLSYVEQHLGHALNCLEGPGGSNFNRAWGHVCQGQGNGILVDLKAAPGGPDLALVAAQADALALAGVKSRNLNEARMAARGVAALLNVIAENLK
jgi:hypothetical protein